MNTKNVFINSALVIGLISTVSTFAAEATVVTPVQDQEMVQAQYREEATAMALAHFEIYRVEILTEGNYEQRVEISASGGNAGKGTEACNDSVISCTATNGSLTLAEESALSNHDQASSMSLQEYENYRAQLQRQIERASPDAANNETGANSDEATRNLTINTDSGYGQGYRARSEHRNSEIRMNGIRSGPMTPSSGRNR